jgi:hypothetical protein
MLEAVGVAALANHCTRCDVAGIMPPLLFWLAIFAAFFGLLAFVLKQRKQIRQIERLLDDTHAP